MGAIGASGGGEFAQDFPFCFGFADLARNLRAEGDAALGGGLDAAVVLFVTRLRGQQQNSSFASMNIWSVRMMSWCTRIGTLAMARAT